MRFFLYCFLTISHLWAIKIDVSQGTVQPDPICIVPFQGCEDISQVVSNDLESSGLFRALDSKGFVQSAESLLKQGVKLADWKVLKTRFLVYGTNAGSDDQLEITFHLWDILLGKNILSLCMKGSKPHSRKLAHMIADCIYTALTNEKGFFNTNIVYVEVLPQKKGQKRFTRLVQVDSDGANPKILTSGTENIVNPSYSNDGQFILYTLHKKDNFSTYIMNTKTGRTEPLIYPSNPMSKLPNFAARFSPSGASVVLSITKNNTTAIYEVDVASRNIKQLTAHNGLDTSPSYSHDGQHILFTSRRSGTENIYVMPSSGGEAQRLTRGTGKYSQPTWSPRGDMIGFIKQEGSQFFVGVMQIDGSGERYIDTSYLLERIAWAPNGRYLVYSKEFGPQSPSGICRSDATGLTRSLVPIGRDGRDATWSPLYQSKAGS